LPGQCEDASEDNVKVIVPTKYKAADENVTEESPFSRKDKLRASFKDQLAKRYNNKKHGDVVSVIQRLQETTSSEYTVYLIHSLCGTQSTWYTVYVVHSIHSTQSTWYTVYLVHSLCGAQYT